MLALSTWMDGDTGYAFPGIRTWAGGARMAVNTLRKHLKSAIEGGWLGVEVSHSKSHHNIYRCAVPLDIELSEKDEMLATALVAQFGDIEDGVSAHSDTRTNGDGVSTMSDTRTTSEDPSKTLRVSNDGSVACQNDPLRVSKEGVRVSNGADRVSPSVTLKSLKLLEVLEHPHREGAVASDVTDRVGGNLIDKPKDPEAELKAAKLRANRIKVALKVFADYSDSDMAKVARVSVAEVQRARKQAQ